MIFLLWATLNLGMMEAQITDPGIVYATPEPAYFIEYAGHVQYGAVHLSAGIDNTFFKNSSDQYIGGFTPIHDEYWIELELIFNDHLSLIGRHMCANSVIVKDVDEYQYDEFYNRVYLHISTRVAQ